jgi:hypothetical protein
MRLRSWRASRSASRAVLREAMWSDANVVAVAWYQIAAANSANATATRQVTGASAASS